MSLTRPDRPIGEWLQVDWTRMRLPSGVRDISHERCALGTVDPSVVTLHHPLVLLVGTGGNRSAVTRNGITALAVLSYEGSCNVKDSDKGCGTDDPPNELDDQADNNQQADEPC